MVCMSGLDFLNFRSTSSSVGVSASDIVDAYDTVMETKNNYVAVKLANNNDSKQRASATVIGANAGLLQMFALGGVYLLAKAFPKLNHPLVDKFIVKKFDKWIARAVEKCPNDPRWYQLMVAFGAKSLYAIATGAAFGYAGGWLSTKRGTVVNGKISGAKSGAEGNWIASGLKSLYASEEGRKIIHNSIHKNDDSVAITFNGIGKTYTVTKDELKKASKEYISRSNEEGKVTKFEKKFSRGDGDVLAFEVAFEKYCKDVEKGVLPQDKNIPMSIQKITEDGDILYSEGDIKGLYYLLTGKNAQTLNPELETDGVMKLSKSIRVDRFLGEYANNPNKYAADIKLKNTTDNKVRIMDRKHSVHKLNTDKNYTITAANPRYITIADSDKLSKKIEVPVSVLKNYVASVNYMDLSK